jgi:hypothetical protein
VQALTPGPRVDCDRQRNLLAGFVRALRNAYEGLKSFYESPSGPIRDSPEGYPQGCDPCGYCSGPTSPSIDRPFPHKDSYTNKGQIELAFKYKSHLVHGALLFLAEHTDPEADAKEILIKSMYVDLFEVRH